MPVIINHEIEIRGTLRATEVRASKAAGKFELTGRAASYDTPTKINGPDGGFIEQCAPGCFSRSLREGADVKATFNHDPNRILGRTKSGTLKLQDSKEGLLFRCILDPTNTDHQNVHASVSRGDHSECSFAFKVPDGGDSWDTTTDPDTGKPIPRRTLKDVDLIDVAPAVTYPAYGGTATQVSARAAAQQITTRPPAALLQAASDAARRSVAVVLGRKIAQQHDADLRARAKRLGAVIAADAAQDKKDNELRGRMESAAGIVFGRRSVADKNLGYPYESASELEGEEGADGEFNAIQSALDKTFPGHKVVGYSPSQYKAFTKHSSGSDWNIHCEKDALGKYHLGVPQLGGRYMGISADGDL